jgi:GT2 family glycosyltransferase
VPAVPNPAPPQSRQRPEPSAGAGDAIASARELLLLIVAYHPSAGEVEQLRACLAALAPRVGYAVVVNDHRPGEPVERLAAAADAFLTNSDNPGYGRAVNRLVERIGRLPPHIGVLNTDLTWAAGSFETLLSWLQSQPDVSLAVPQILDRAGRPQQLCKQHPTVLGLCSRRFLPEWLKPGWLKRYDRWYAMVDRDGSQVFEVPYLSGCCMLMRSDAFLRVGGFDERYFLYLEDADLTRSLAREGRCLHLPLAPVVHGWGRGNHRSLWLTVVNLHSAWLYFSKWGWRWW